MSYVQPPPWIVDGELETSTIAIASLITRGRYGTCCVCQGTCYTWWSPTAPSGYVPLHAGRCPAALVEHWRGVIADGEGSITPQALFVPPSGRRGAYARRDGASDVVATVKPRQHHSMSGATLPDGFTPGPFWLPGDDANTPWSVVLETASGHTLCPAGGSEEHAYTVYRHYQARPILDLGGVAVVGAVVIGPDGTRTREWGSAPVLNASRWESISKLSDWRRCTECGDLRWPGTWVSTFGGRCRSCQAATELGDPRPWPDDAVHPGMAFAPEWATKVKKVTAPAVARRLPSLPKRKNLRSRAKGG